MQAFSRFLERPPRVSVASTRLPAGPVDSRPPAGDEAGVPTFLVERYVPDAGLAQLAEITDAAKQAAHAAPAGAGVVRYLAATLVPADELCHCLFEGPSIEAVRLMTEAGQFPNERIVAAWHVTADPPDPAQTATKHAADPERPDRP